MLSCAQMHIYYATTPMTKGNKQLAIPLTEHSQGKTFVLCRNLVANIHSTLLKLLSQVDPPLPHPHFKGPRLVILLLKHSEQSVWWDINVSTKKQAIRTHNPAPLKKATGFCNSIRTETYKTIMIYASSISTGEAET